MPTQSIAITPIPTRGVYPPETSLVAQALQSIPALPAKGAEVTIAGVRVTRISDDGKRHAYSKVQPLSQHGAYLFLHYGWQLLNGQTYALIANLNNIAGDRAQWSTKAGEEHITYGAADGQPSIRRNDMLADTTAVVHTFDRNISIGNGEGGISDNGVICVQDAAGNLATYSTWDDTATSWFSTGVAYAPDSCTMSHDGTKAIAVFEAPNTGVGAGKGIWVWDRDGSNGHQIRTLGNHGDSGVSMDGRQVWLTVSPDVTMIDLVTGSSVTLLDSPVAFTAGHVSGRGAHGWATLSVYDVPQAGVPGDDKVFEVKLDGSKVGHDYGFQQHRSAVYEEEPQAVSLGDGRVIFASEWGQTGRYFDFAVRY